MIGTEFLMTELRATSHQQLLRHGRHVVAEQLLVFEAGLTVRLSVVVKPHSLQVARLQCTLSPLRWRKQQRWRSTQSAKPSICPLS